MDTAVQSYATSHSDDEGYAGRIDVVTGPSGRRRWPEHVKDVGAWSLANRFRHTVPFH